MFAAFISFFCASFAVAPLTTCPGWQEGGLGGTFSDVRSASRTSVNLTNPGIGDEPLSVSESNETEKAAAQNRARLTPDQRAEVRAAAALVTTALPTTTRILPLPHHVKPLLIC